MVSSAPSIAAGELDGLLAGLQAVLWIAAPDTLAISSVSGHAESLFGHPPSSWLAAPSFFGDHLHPDERAVTLALCRAVSTDGRQRHFVHRFRAADGTDRWVRTVVSARMYGGAVRELLGLTASVPYDAHLEHAARVEREGEAQRLLLEQLPAIVWTADRALRFTSGSGAGLAAIGLQADRLVGASIPEYFRVDDPAHPHLSAHERALAGEKVSFESEWIGRDYQIYLEPFRSRSGEIVGVIGVALDITKRKRAETERDAQRRLLEAILDNALEGVFVCDVAGRFTLINAAGARMVGSVDEPAARSVAEMIERRRLCHPDGRLYAYEEMPLVRALGGEIVALEEMVVDHGGHRLHFLVNATPLRDERGATVGAVAVARDESGRIELETLKDQFLRVAAHELRTPVTVMKANAQGLLRTQAVPPSERPMVEAINRGADRITRIVEDLIDLSQVDIGRLSLGAEVVDLTEVVGRAVERLGRAGVKRDLVVRAEPAPVRGDRARLEQSVRILLDNAIKYSPAGGPIEIAIVAEAGSVVLSVRDHGVGIPRDKQLHIFERFYRAHTDTPHDYGGLGVGLYLLREIVRGHGGQTWFESAPGEGSTFYVRIPRLR